MSALTSGGRATLDSLLETVRSLFSGDREIRRNVAFSVALIALSAKMAKADGIVTSSEIVAFRQILEIPDAELRNVFRLYDLARQDTAGFEEYARKLTHLCGDAGCDDTFLGDVLDGLFHIAKADGVVHERELDVLARIAAIFGLTEGEFERTRLRHTRGEENPYIILGLDPDAGPKEARARYLTLVRENHPDSLVARGVPDEFTFIATERMKAINSAYAMIERRAGA
ncbi:DnaJ family molecular chaperone [Aurantimonas sp. Leaf443]|uniref:DnaJ family molecular chaperone n=1 Tax=Aurantimonas sp. Leaf443 TaxID=1736378 RepID=UPI003297304B